MVRTIGDRAVRGDLRGGVRLAVLIERLLLLNQRLRLISFSVLCFSYEAGLTTTSLLVLWNLNGLSTSPLAE